MKNWKFLVPAVGFMICLAFQDKARTYPVSLTVEKWSAYLNGLEYTKQQLRASDLPSKQVALITDSVLTPMQTDISNQVQALLVAEKAAQQKPKDSIKPKKN